MRDGTWMEVNMMLEDIGHPLWLDAVEEDKELKLRKESVAALQRGHPDRCRTVTICDRRPALIHHLENRCKF
jgi:hypothetical protein